MEEQLEHFSHEHMLSLVRLQSDPNKENSDKQHEDGDESEDEGEEDKDDFVVEGPYVGKCEMCTEGIYSFHKYYYRCKACDYSLHKFCAQLPATQQNYPLHPGHNLTLSKGCQFHDPTFYLGNSFRRPVDYEWSCNICKSLRKMFYNYHCHICKFNMDIICATISEQKMDHPSHPHQLQRYISRMISRCNACSEEHSGTFYHCTTCSSFSIHLDCALLPSKLLIQQSTNESFSHPHFLTLAYSFPYIEKKAKFFPGCRVCGNFFMDENIKWHYGCNKCQYYIHVDCATSKGDAFMSILKPAGLGKTYKNFKDDDYPNLIRCPFRDESFNLLKHLFINKGELITKGKVIDGDVFNHQHPLILFDTHACLLNGSVSLHDPMRKVELLCDGCVRPITDVSFYKCSQNHCCFVLHEWCTRLPSEIQNYHGHPEHKLVLLPKISKNILGLFRCEICELKSNGFAYGCKQCEYYVDINCAFIPNVITHDSHPNHLLQRVQVSTTITRICKVCLWSLYGDLSFHCPTCDFYIHAKCALLLPGTITHKYDKHSLSLRYGPAENHSNEYFCEICEEEFDPEPWFYHCSTCDSSMHTACAPLILQCEQSTYSKDRESIFKFINVKFGGTLETVDHPHHLTIVQGLNADGRCIVCNKRLQYKVILKCSQCKFARHYRCVSSVPSNLAIRDA